jgi:hypothetical protein
MRPIADENSSHDAADINQVHLSPVSRRPPNVAPLLAGAQQ